MDRDCTPADGVMPPRHSVAGTIFTNCTAGLYLSFTHSAHPRRTDAPASGDLHERGRQRLHHLGSRSGIRFDITLLTDKSISNKPTDRQNFLIQLMFSIGKIVVMHLIFMSIYSARRYCDPTSLLVHGLVHYAVCDFRKV